MEQLIETLQKTQIEVQCDKCKKYVSNHKSQAYFGGGTICEICIKKLKIEFKAIKKAAMPRDNWPNN